MSADQAKGSGSLRCLAQIEREEEEGGEKITSTHSSSYHFEAIGATTQHTFEHACAQHTYTLDSDNEINGVGATALDPALSRLTGLTTLNLRCAPPRVSDLSRLSRSGTAREMHGEETMEGQGEVAST